MEMFSTSDKMKIAYYVDDYTDPWTKPETLLLLHAAMGNSQRWFAWMPALARKFRVVRMDLRGHGASQTPAPETAFSLAQLVGDAVELLEYGFGAERDRQMSFAHAWWSNETQDRTLGIRP